MALQILLHIRAEASAAGRSIREDSNFIMRQQLSIARAKFSTSAARTGSRWSAFAPVEVGVLSMTYSRFMLPHQDCGAWRIADVSRVAGESRVEEVGVERDDDVGFREVVARFDRLSERQLRAFEHVVAIHRLVDVPLGLRINLQESRSWSASVGEETVCVRIRMPAPCKLFCALSGPRIAPRNAPHERMSPSR